MGMVLAFGGGKVSGSGTDDINNFLIEGSYDEKKMTATWIKTYPSHKVDYRGDYKDGRLNGTWHIGNASAGFLLRPGPPAIPVSFPPSSEWDGFYLYTQDSKQVKHGMTVKLTFVNMVVAGTGSDDIGPFTIKGSYNTMDGAIRFDKTYKTHVVHYVAKMEDGRMTGTWEVGGTVGGFLLHPRVYSEKLAKLFPAGKLRWSGTYTHNKQQHAMNLELVFDSGSITGGGKDDVNTFTIQGSYDEKGSIVWTKIYPSHRVNYEGAWKDQKITGKWSLFSNGSTLSDVFSLAPPKA
jgi:antitoxin component YwqK of YwqJK toxin-antitoxin module